MKSSHTVIHNIFDNTSLKMNAVTRTILGHGDNYNVHLFTDK